MRAVILGGTFNPVHFGHLFIAEEVLTSLGYDKAIFVPAHQPVHKDPTPVIDSRHRLAMLRLAVQAGASGRRKLILVTRMDAVEVVDRLAAALGGEC